MNQYAATWPVFVAKNYFLRHLMNGKNFGAKKRLMLTNTVIRMEGTGK